MFPDLLDALIRPAAYRRFASEKPARTASYVAFLSLVFVAALGVAVKLRLAPLFDATFQWLETSMPVLHFSSGGVTSDLPGPTRLEHPRYKEVAVLIDTARKDAVAAKELEDKKVLAVLTSNALYLSRGQGQVETIDLSKAALERPVTVDAETYKEMESTFDWVFYPLLLLFFFLVFAISVAFFGLVYGLLGMLYASLAGGSLGFAELFRLAVHAQTAAALLRSLDTLLPFAIPYSGWISLALSLGYLWLGVKAAVSAPPPAPASTPAAPPPAA